MIFYCPNCWSRVKEDEKVCPECKTEIETLDHRSYFEKLINALSHSERTTRLRAAYILGELHYKRAVKPLAEALNRIRGMHDVFFAEAVAVVLGKIDGGRGNSSNLSVQEHPFEDRLTNKTLTTSIDGRVAEFFFDPQ